jgi:hypothetical protein
LAGCRVAPERRPRPSPRGTSSSDSRDLTACSGVMPAQALQPVVEKCKKAQTAVRYASARLIRGEPAAAHVTAASLGSEMRTCATPTQARVSSHPR